MSLRHVVVDGSNIATEGRTLPSLAQLDQAVREFISENPKDVVTVVVDASFGHRIDPSELPTFEEAEAAGEVVSPPAGAIGRGDAFLLRIAEKTGATVLSNDSFQEFHGDHEWLFEKGRLIGGKPVPGVGWIFMERTPVRGHKSREVVKEAKRRKRETDDTTVSSSAAAKVKSRPKSVDRAIAKATQEVVEPKDGARGRRRAGAPPSDPVNEPLAFITFIAAHPLGNEVVGEVVEYSSHGAFVEADGARCYMPLSAMADPPPRKAREVVTKGESRTFIVQAFDPQRRGIELAMPGFANVTGTPTAETVEAEITQTVTVAKPSRRRGAKLAVADSEQAQDQETETPVASEPAPRARRARKSTTKIDEVEPAPALGEEPGAGQGPVEDAARPAKKAATRRSAAKKATGPVEAAPSPPLESAEALTSEAAPPGATSSAPAKAAPAMAGPAKTATVKRSPRKAAAAPSVDASEAPTKKAAGAKKVPVEAGAAKQIPARKSTTTAKAAAKLAPRGGPTTPDSEVGHEDEPKKATRPKQNPSRQTASKQATAAKEATAKRASIKAARVTKATVTPEGPPPADAEPKSSSRRRSSSKRSAPADS